MLPLEPIRCARASSRQHLRNGTILAMGSAGSTRIEVTAHRSDLGRWRAAQRPAEPRLRECVVGYFASEGFLPKPLHERHLPLQEIAIVLVQDASVRRVGSSPLASRALDRGDVVGNPVATTVFEICDLIYLADPRIGELRN